MCRSHFLRAKFKMTCSSRRLLDTTQNTFNTGEHMVMKLKRSLYGLSQSPTLRYDTIDVALLGIGFTPTSSDPCVFTRGSNDTCAMLTLCLDDILISRSNHGVVKRLKKALMDRFAMTGHGRSQPHPPHECYKNLRRGHVDHYAKILRPLRPEHPRKVRDAGLQLRSHTGILT